MAAAGRVTICNRPAVDKNRPASHKWPPTGDELARAMRHAELDLANVSAGIVAELEHLEVDLRDSLMSEWIETLTCLAEENAGTAEGELALETLRGIDHPDARSATERLERR